jgi:hypothetical protein
MPAELFGNRFYGGRGQGAWHNRGFVDDLQHTAADAFAMIGTYDVLKLQLQTIVKRQDGTHIEVPYFGLVRTPTSDDPVERVFGTVSADYTLVNPEAFVNLWDERVRKAVETLLALKDGKMLVITSKLPAFDVKGDEIENYIMAWSMMDGSTASGTSTQSMRVVCKNTFDAALAMSRNKASFVHDAWILQRMGRWLEDVVQRAEAQLPELQEAYETLANYPLTKARPEAPREIKHVLATAYPSMPRYEPDVLLTDEQNQERAKRRDNEIRIVDERRVQAFELFKGAGTGMRTTAAMGTMWGLYQSVVELEDWKGGSKGDGLSHSVLFGERAEAKSRAFGAAMAVATGKAGSL